MTVKEKFMLGDRVKMTAAGEARFGPWPKNKRRGPSIKPGYNRGEIVGFSHDPLCARVRRDGYSEAETWNMEFWEIEE